ncbi:hypothetical protein [Actinoallomurus sp. NPDC052274]|uniref:hypothetical protein n=1 Tax=Actinoallomurus sp. NPDC052274 TaxID=3155420 RepID=UPI00344A4FF9
MSPMTDAERIDFADLCRDLQGIVCDYPYCDPASVLQVAAWDLRDRTGDGQHPGREDAPGLLLALHAASWYAVSGRIDDLAVVDSMIEALERAAAGYEAGSCPHPGGEGHPDLTDESPDSIVSLILPLYDEEGWADYYGTDFAEAAGERARWSCPGFLRGVAENTLAALRAGRDELFGPPNIDALERVYLKPDGRADTSRLTRDAGDAWCGGSPGLTEKASVLAAHRLAHGALEEERLPLSLTVGFAVRHATWKAIPPETAELYHRALEAPLAAPCPHSDGHPGVDVEARDWARLARALHDPDAERGMAVDEAAVRCPRFAAERAVALLRVTGEHLARD